MLRWSRPPIRPGFVGSIRRRWSHPRWGMVGPLLDGLPLVFCPAVSLADREELSSRCVRSWPLLQAATAEREIRSRLGSPGLDRLTIIPPKKQTSASTGPWSNWLKPANSQLLPAVSPDVCARAFCRLREEAFSACMTKEGSSSTRVDADQAGASDFVIRTDGHFQIPLDREKELLAHYEAVWLLSTYGCSMSGSTSSTGHVATRPPRRKPRAGDLRAGDRTGPYHVRPRDPL